MTMGAKGKKRTISSDEIETEYEKNFFSQHAISKLDKRVREEKELNTKNLVYIQVDINIDSFNFKELWLEVDAFDDEECASLSGIDYDMKMAVPPELLPELLDLEDYRSHVWTSKSMIIMVGGTSKTSKGKSDKVYMYDIILKKWETSTMKAKRGDAPVVVSTDDKIFVFGGSPSFKLDPKDLSMEHNPKKHIQELKKSMYALWFEYFDFNTGLWNSFPEDLAREFAKLNLLNFHTVCPNQQIILFWMPSSRILYFDYKNWKLGTYDDHMSIVPDLTWSTGYAVLEDFLFWNDQSTIYAHDLHGHITLPVCTLPDSNFFGAGASPYRYYKCFLVHVGEGMLCLFGNADRFGIWYITFLVQISGKHETATVHLVADRAGYFKTSVLSVSLAMEISSSVRK